MYAAEACRNEAKLNYVHPPMVVPKIFDFSIWQIATCNSREKIKSAIPREQNCATWLVKNGKTVFSKLTGKISLSVSNEQASKHSAYCFPFSDFEILSSLLDYYLSGISCTFYFWQMFNGFLTSTFDIY